VNNSYKFGKVFIPVYNGKKSYQNLSKTIIVTVENKVKHFYSLRCNGENFYDVQCLTVMTSGYCGVFIPVSKGIKL